MILYRNYQGRMCVEGGYAYTMAFSCNTHLAGLGAIDVDYWSLTS